MHSYVKEVKEYDFLIFFYKKKYTNYCDWCVIKLVLIMNSCKSNIATIIKIVSTITKYCHVANILLKKIIMQIY